jgi:hypothetical protein
MAPKARRRFKKSTFFKVNSPGLATLRGFASGQNSQERWKMADSFLPGAKYPQLFENKGRTNQIL